MIEGLVSVIIPAYNVDKYIEECLQSIQRQSYQNIEVIVIDDVSSDKTVSVVTSLQLLDKRIKLILSEQNGGSAVARQKGINESLGEMITFVDADDKYCSQKAIEKYVKAYKDTNSDCVMFEYQTRHKYGLIRKKRFNGHYGIYSSAEVAEAKSCHQSPHWHYVWNKCFNGDLLRNGAVKFHAELRLAQDVRFNEDFLKCARSFYVMEHSCFYEYNCTNVNQVTRKNLPVSLDNQLDRFDHLKENLSRLQDDYLKIGASSHAQNGLREQFYRNVRSLLLRNNSFVWADELKEIVEKDQIYQDCKKQISNRAVEVERQVEWNMKIHQIKTKIKKVFHI